MDRRRNKINVLDKERKSKRARWLTVREVNTVAKGGYFDIEGVLHNAVGCPRCTSVMKSTGKRCKNFAVPGELHCHIHGGVLARAKAGKARIYSAFIEDASLKALYESSTNDEEVEGIREELALLRTLLAGVIKDGISEPEDLKRIAGTIGEIRKLIESCTKIELRLGQLIDIGKVVLITAALAKIISKYVTDKEVLEKIAHEFDRLIIPVPLASTPQPAKRTPSREVPRLSGEVSS